MRNVVFIFYLFIYFFIVVAINYDNPNRYMLIYGLVLHTSLKTFVKV